MKKTNDTKNTSSNNDPNDLRDWKKVGMIPLNDVIQRIKQDLQHEITEDNFPVFYLDEITVEISFVVAGDTHGGFDLVVASLGSQVSEERTQKISLKLTPFISKEDVFRRLQVELARVSASKEGNKDTFPRANTLIYSPTNTGIEESILLKGILPITHGDKPGDNDPGSLGGLPGGGIPGIPPIFKP